MNKLGVGLIALLLMLDLQACKVGRRPTHKKVIVDSTTVARRQDSVKTVELNKEKQQLINDLSVLWKKQLDFKTFNAKIKAHYQGPDQKQEFTANIRIEKDKTIWANVTALGLVNVARIIITPDSFKMINYLENKVILMSLKDAKDILPVPVDFQVIQNLLIGNVLKQSGSITDATDFGGSWTLHTADDDYVQQYIYNKADSTIRTAQLMSKKYENAHGVIQQGNYEVINGRKVSTTRSMNMMANGKTHILDMNYNKVDFDEPVDFPFSIPKKYIVNGQEATDDTGKPRIQRREDRKVERKENKVERKENKDVRKASKGK